MPNYYIVRITTDGDILYGTDHWAHIYDICLSRSDADETVRRLQEELEAFGDAAFIDRHLEGSATASDDDECTIEIDVFPFHFDDVAHVFGGSSYME